MNLTDGTKTLVGAQIEKWHSLYQKNVIEKTHGPEKLAISSLANRVQDYPPESGLTQQMVKDAISEQKKITPQYAQQLDSLDTVLAKIFTLAQRSPVVAKPTGLPGLRS